MISKLYFNKNKKITEECKEKKVLDLGVVDHDVEYERRENWLHGDIKKVAKELTGLDIDEEAAKILKKKGYNVFAGNAESFNLKKKFDVVVAGDLIEHLNNVGEFLESVKKHMTPGSKLIITTPNCLSLSNSIEAFIFGKIKYFNEEHTHWYDESTIKRQLENYNFSVEEISFIVHNPHFIEESRLRYLLKNLRFVLQVFVCSLRKQLAPTMLIKARLK